MDDHDRQMVEARLRLAASAEQQVTEAAGAAIRGFLRHATATVGSLTASMERPWRLFTVGEASGWWRDQLDEHVVAAVHQVWQSGWRSVTAEVSDLSRVDSYLTAVTDRLSRTATPTLPDFAMDRVRVAMADEIGRGSSPDTIQRRLAADLGWSPDRGFWRARLSELDARVDGILDPLGPPGSPAREAARWSDPQVRDLQRQRAYASREAERSESVWRVRAERIGRTEAQAALNHGSLNGMLAEDVPVKVWIATGDPRTRDDHLEAHGQCVPTADPFEVGGELLAHPGDPSGSARQTIQCRCVMVSARSCDDAQARYGGMAATIQAEQQRRSM